MTGSTRARPAPLPRSVAPALALAAGAAAIAIIGLAGTPARAFDCARASAPVEHAICGDSGAKAADDAMGAAYRQMLDGIPAEMRSDAVASQRAWLRWRDSVCAEWDGDGFRVDCLRSVTEARTRVLLATPEVEGPGAPDLVPRFVWREGDGRTYEIDIQYPQVASPRSAAERALNAALESLAMADADMLFAPPEPDLPEPIGQNYYLSDFRVARADGTLVSVVQHVEAYGGGAHPNRWSRSVNFLLQEGRALQFDDLFDETGAAGLRKLCRAEIVAEKRAREIPEEFLFDFLTDDALDAVIRDPGQWSFPGGLSIAFDPYAIGAYAEGSYECTVPPDALSRLLRPGAPLTF